MTRCGIGERYWAATRERLREPVPICDYLDNLRIEISSGRGLLLLGGIGTGKTSALALVAYEAHALVPFIPAVWYTTTSRLVSHLLRGTEMRREWVDSKSSYGAMESHEQEVDPKQWPLLLLDEFGAPYESEYAVAAIEDYLGWRYDRKLATCVGANLTPDQLRDIPHYARMVDRWRETCKVVAIGGASMRPGQREADAT